MHGEVRRWLRDHSWAIHVPRPLQERVLAVTRATGELRTRDGRSPTAGQIAERLVMPLEDVLEALAGRPRVRRRLAQAPLGGDPEAGTLGDMLGAEDERLDRAEQVASLGSLRDLLDDRDREVLRLRFVEDLTQSEIADRIGCSQMQVSRLLRRSIDRLSARRPRRTTTTKTTVGAVAVPGS